MKHTHLNRTKRHAGFTLIELLVVVAIIAVTGIVAVAAALLVMPTIVAKHIAWTDTMLPIVRIMMKPAVRLSRKKSWSSVPPSASRLLKNVGQPAKHMRRASRKS